MKILLVLLFLSSSDAIALDKKIADEIVNGLNPYLKKVSKIEVPPNSEEDFYRQIEIIGKKKDKSTKALWALAERKDLTCSFFSSQAVVPPLTGILDLSKKMNEEVAKENSWKKGLQAAKLWQKVSLCEAPLIFNRIFLSSLKATLTTLSTLPKDKMTKSEKVELEKLKERLLNANAKEDYRKALRSEMVATSYIILKATEDGTLKPSKSMFLQTDINSSEGKNPEGLERVLTLLLPEEGMSYDWKKGGQYFATLIDATTEKDADAINAVSQNQKEKALQNFYVGMSFSELGISSAKDFSDKNKMNELAKKLETNAAILRKKKDLLKAYPNKEEFFTAGYFVPMMTLNYEDQEKKWQTSYEKMKELAKSL